MFHRKHYKLLSPPVRTISVQSSPTAVNTEILKTPSMTSEMRSGQENIQAAESILTPSLSQIIERKTWEHGQLRQKLLCFQGKYGAALHLYEVSAHVAAALEEVILDFDSFDKDIGNDFGGNFSLSLKNINTSQARPTAKLETAAYSRGRTVIPQGTPMPNLSLMTEDRKQENIQLEQELAYLEKRHRAVKYLYKEMSSLVDILNAALHNFSTLITNESDHSNDPPAPTIVDIQIARKYGSTMAIEAGQDRVQAAKRMPTPDLSQMVRERTDQVIYLQRELEFLERKHGATEYFYHEVRLVLVSLHKALLQFQTLKKNAGDL
jgi:hypothetical protein